MSRTVAAFAVLTAGLGALSASDSLWVVLRPGCVPFVLLILTVLLAAGSGRVLAGRLGLSDMSESQKTLVGATLGLGMLALGGFFLGALGLFQPWAASAFLAALWVVGYAELKPALKSLSPDQNLLRERPLAALAVALPLLAALWMCLVPAAPIRFVGLPFGATAGLSACGTIVRPARHRLCAFPAER